MKGFFKQYSYNIVKNLVNQFAISVFGAFLSMATTAAKNDTLSIIVSSFAILFYLFLVYTTTWDIGSKDRVSVDVGKKTYHSHTGLLISLVSNIPNILIAILFAVAKIFVKPGNFFDSMHMLLSVFSMIFEGMYTGLMMSIPVSANGTTMINTWWAYFVIIIPAIVTSWIAYIAGYKNFRLIAPLFDKKSKKIK